MFNYTCPPKLAKFPNRTVVTALITKQEHRCSGRLLCDRYSWWAPAVHVSVCPTRRCVHCKATAFLQFLFRGCCRSINCRKECASCEFFCHFSWPPAASLFFYLWRRNRNPRQIPAIKCSLKGTARTTPSYFYCQWKSIVSLFLATLSVCFGGNTHLLPRKLTLKNGTLNSCRLTQTCDVNNEKGSSMITVRKWMEV